MSTIIIKMRKQIKSKDKQIKELKETISTLQKQLLNKDDNNPIF